MIKRYFYAYGNLEFGPGNFIDFNGKKIEAYSSKQAKFLLAKELSETTLKHMNRLAIYRSLKRVKISKNKYKK